MNPDFLSSVTDKAKLLELLAARESGQRRMIDEIEMAASLKRRVKGQDHVVDDITRLIKLQWAKEKRRRPIASVLMLGPTGTGKSELGKALAEYLFGEEKACLIFDGPDFSGPEAKNRLIGVPTGYQGADAGGALTRPMLSNPRRLILFEEIEKSWNGIFDLFLSLMGDGRLNEAGGKVADFTQSIICLTSNAEHDAIGKIQNEISDPHEMTNAVKSHLADAKVFRPEIIARFDRVYVFKPLTTLIKAEIVAQKARNIAKEYGLSLDYIDPYVIIDALGKSEKIDRFGIRELERVVNELLAEQFVAARERREKNVRVETDDGRFVVVGSPVDVGRSGPSAAPDSPSPSASRMV